MSSRAKSPKKKDGGEEESSGGGRRNRDKSPAKGNETGKSGVLPSVVSGTSGKDGSKLGGGKAESKAEIPDWELAVLEAEKLNADFVLINPPKLREALRVQMQPYIGTRKIVIFKMMKFMQYSQHKCEMILHILQKAPDERLDEVLEVINSYIPKKLEALVFKLFHLLTPKGFYEYVYELPREQFELIIDILRHVPDDEIDNFVQYVETLSWREVIALLNHCNEPMAKHCRMCRMRRLDDLNTVVNNGQLPEHLMPITANLALLPDSKAEVWTNEEHRDFKFDWEKGIIYWKGRQNVVDLVRICNKCLELVFGALPTINRTDPIYHTDAPERKKILYEQKDREQKRAVLIGKIAVEQVRRRVREWSLRVLELQRLAIKKENDEKKLQNDMAKYNEMIEKEEEAERNMIKKAMSIDDQLNEFVKQETQDEAKLRIMKAEMNWHLPYSDENPFVPKRENAHSWRLDPVDGNNVPISPRRALKMFSTQTSAIRKLQWGQDINLQDKNYLTEMKNMTIDAHREYLAEQADFERRKKDANTKYCEDIREYVDNRILRLNRTRLRMAYQQEREEDERINRRAEEKKQRRLARIARYEEIERSLMEAEDFLSANFRMDKWEAIREAHERDEMYNEELDQTEVDRFWGFDLYEEKKAAELERLRAFYVNRVKVANEKLAYAKVVNKYVIEADHILARDENALLDELARINVMKQRKGYI